MKSLSRVQLFSTPWTAAYQAPPSMGFSRQEYWSGLPLPSVNFNYYSIKKVNITPHLLPGSHFHLFIGGIYLKNVQVFPIVKYIEWKLC